MSLEEYYTDALHNRINILLYTIVLCIYIIGFVSFSILVNEVQE